MKTASGKRGCSTAFREIHGGFNGTAHEPEKVFDLSGKSVRRLDTTDGHGAGA